MFNKVVVVLVVVVVVVVVVIIIIIIICLADGFNLETSLRFFDLLCINNSIETAENSHFFYVLPQPGKKLCNTAHVFHFPPPSQPKKGQLTKLASVFSCHAPIPQTRTLIITNLFLSLKSATPSPPKQKKSGARVLVFGFFGGFNVLIPSSTVISSATCACNSEIFRSRSITVSSSDSKRRDCAASTWEAERWGALDGEGLVRR